MYWVVLYKANCTDTVFEYLIDYRTEALAQAMVDRMKAQGVVHAWVESRRK